MWMAAGLSSLPLGHPKTRHDAHFLRISICLMPMSYRAQSPPSGAVHRHLRWRAMNASHRILHKVVGKSKQGPLPTQKCPRKASRRRWGCGWFHRLNEYPGGRTVLGKVMEGWYGFSWLRSKLQNHQGNLVSWLETWSFFSANWLFVPNSKNRFFQNTNRKML